MVCRLCGAANTSQQASCVSCGAPLEHTPDTRSTRKHAGKRSAWPIWLALCLTLGAALGFTLTRLRSPDDPHAYLPAIIIGALAGGLLGGLPGPAFKRLCRAWSGAMAGLFSGLATRRLERVRQKCEKAIESGGGEADTRCRLAAALWLQHHQEQAEQVLQRALREDDKAAVAHHNFGVAHAAAGRQARALEEFERARSTLNRSPNLYWNLGLVRWMMSQMPGAADAFRQAAEIEGDHLAARNALALSLARQGETDQAIQQLEGLLARRRHPDTLCNLGVIHQSRGALEEAVGYFTGALLIDTAHCAARYNRGVCAILEGSFQAAIEDFQTLAHIAPDHAWGLIQRAISCYRLGHRERALEAMRRAIRLAPTDFQVRYNSGTLLLGEEMIERAVSELEKAYELNQSSIEVIINVGVAMYLSGHVRQSLDHFRVATRMNPRHALARYNSVVASSMLDQLEEAEKEVEELVALYPDFPDAFNAIGVIRLLQNRLVEAAEQFRRVADHMPRSAIIRANLALTYYFEGDLAAAAEQATFAVGIDPDLAAARDVAGHVALELNHTEEAVKHFRHLVKLEPANPDAHSNLGLAYYKDDRLTESIESYKRVLIFSPKSPEGHNDLGLAYAKDKMLNEAAKHLAQVIEWRPDSPVLHSNLGLVYFFKGDTENAVQEWREVTRLSPVYARMREATRFSAYDDQEMHIRSIERRLRVTHLALKTAAFRHSFQLALEENGFRLELPWPDLSAAARWQEWASAARRASRRP